MVSLGFEMGTSISSSLITDKDDLRAATDWRHRVVTVTASVHQLQHAVVVRQLLVGKPGAVRSFEAKYSTMHYNIHFESTTTTTTTTVLQH